MKGMGKDWNGQIDMYTFEKEENTIFQCSRVFFHGKATGLLKGFPATLNSCPQNFMWISHDFPTLDNMFAGGGCQ